MALKTPKDTETNNKDFFLRTDVRETAGISGAPTIGDFTNSQHTHSDAATGGLTTHASGDGSDHADVLTNTGDIATINSSNVTSTVAGAGIDVSGATGAVTISAEDSTAGNKGIVIISPGEGMDVSYTSGTATIAGEDSAVGNKGIVIVAGGEGMDVSYGSGTATVSGEDASTSNKGIASYETDDFTVTSGEVSLKNKTSYWSAPGSEFVCLDEADDSLVDGDNGASTPNSGTVYYTCAVHIPHGAIITGCIVYTEGTLKNWRLYRDTHARSGSPTIMAAAASNTEDTSITSGTVDNSTYSYWVEIIEGVTNATIIDSLRIKYTTDYI